MNKILKSILIISIAILGVTALGVSFAQAQAGLQVEFETGNDPAGDPYPLFNEADFKPGDRITRWVKVTNNSGTTQSIATEAINYPGFPNIENVPADDLSRALDIIIREKNGSDLYGSAGKTLFSFYEHGETYLSDVNNGKTQEYEFEISFPLDKSDQWQNAVTNFDIIIGSCEDCGNGNGDNGDGDGDNGDNGNGDDNGNGGGGGGLPLGLTIQYENSRVSTTTATITWLTSYKSTSRVIYDIVPDQFNLYVGEPGYGYTYYTDEYDTPANANGVTGHSITIYNLTSGTEYYFRCVSHASPDTIGTEHSFTTLAISTDSHSEEVSPTGETTEESPGTGDDAGNGADADNGDATDAGNDDTETPQTVILNGAERSEESLPDAAISPGDDQFDPDSHIYKHQEDPSFRHSEPAGEESLATDIGDFAGYSKFLASIGAYFHDLEGWRLILIFLLWIILLLIIIRLIKAYIDRKKKTE